MTTSISTPVQADRRPAALALLLGILGVPGVTIAWDLPAGGFWIGIPLAVAAIVLGLRARDGADRRARRLATAGIVLGAIEILFTALWMVVAAVSG